MIKSSLRNKLLFLLLSVALIPFFVIAILVYNASSDAIIQSHTEKLESIRNLTKKELLRYFTYQHDIVQIIAEDKMVKESFYELYALQKRSKISDNARFPFESKDVQKIYRKYDDYINWYVYKHNFMDMYFIEADSGQVIYTVKKDADIGANLKVGGLKKSALAWSFYHAVRNRKVSFEDMYESQNKEREPSMLLSVPVMTEGKVIGVIALRFGFDKINEIVAAHLGDAKNQGVYLVGEDMHLRSNSAFEPISMSIQQSLVRHHKGKVDSKSIQNALNGVENSEIIHLGKMKTEVLSAYTPVYFLGANWVLLSESLTKHVDESMSSIFWEIILVAILIMAVLVGLSFIMEKSLKRIWQRNVETLAFSNYTMGSNIESLTHSLSLLSNKTEDQSLQTSDLYNRFEHTLNSEEKRIDILKAARLLGKRMVQAITENDKKIEKTLWQLTKMGEATQALKVLVERINEVSLQTNLLALDADDEAKKITDGSEKFATIADKTKILSIQMAQVSKDIQAFIENALLHVDEGKVISSNMGKLVEIMQDSTNKSNQLLEKYTQAYEKNILSYKQIFNTMEGSDIIVEENVLASKQISAQMQELYAMHELMSEKVISLAHNLGVELSNATIETKEGYNFQQLSYDKGHENALQKNHEAYVSHELSKL